MQTRLGGRSSAIGVLAKRAKELWGEEQNDGCVIKAVRIKVNPKERFENEKETEKAGEGEEGHYIRRGCTARTKWRGTRKRLPALEWDTASMASAVTPAARQLRCSVVHMFLCFLFPYALCGCVFLFSKSRLGVQLAKPRYNPISPMWFPNYILYFLSSMTINVPEKLRNVSTQQQVQKGSTKHRGERENCLYTTTHASFGDQNWIRREPPKSQKKL